RSSGLLRHDRRAPGCARGVARRDVVFVRRGGEHRGVRRDARPAARRTRKVEGVMKHTAVYVEQVIIGFCVLVIVDVLLTGRVPSLSKEGLLEGAIVIGASYVVGILYDRCADSLLDRVDRWNRITYATRGAAADGIHRPYWRKDPFPEFSSKFLGG